MSVLVLRPALLCRIASLFACAVGLVAACSPERAENDEITGEITSPVQTAYAGAHFDIVQDQSLASKATGSIQVAIRDASGYQDSVLGTDQAYPVRGTCGVTFVSPHYAFTAAHCVSSTNVPDPTLTLGVTTFDLSAVDRTALLATAAIQGLYPNYVPAGARANQLAGFRASLYGCTVAARCSYGALNCDFAADIAMVHCPFRADDAPWIPVAASDPLTGPVEMYWFHELLTVPYLQTPPAGSPQVAFDEYKHYTTLAVGKEKDNFHYLGSPTNVLLPLKSVPWPDGTPRTRLGNSITDMFACHGTSGSGVLQKTASGGVELLGPVKEGFDWVGSRLCADPTSSSYGPGKAVFSYTPNVQTNQLQALYQAQLTADRYPCQPGQTRTCGHCGTQLCGANYNWGTCGGEGCQPGSTITEACGNCGRRVDTCSSSCQWVAGACSNEGVCAPGATKPCCSCSKGCSCGGAQTCTSSCTWGSCNGQTCKPLSCN